MVRALPAPDVRPERERAEPADLTIGLPTTGDSSNVTMVAKVTRDGLLAHLAGFTAVLIHVDATLPDERVGEIEPMAEGVRLLRARPAGALSSGDRLDAWSEAVRTVLAASQAFQSRAVVMLNPSLASMTPDWVRGLARPVLEEGCALVLPIYERERYEGTLTQVLVVPLVRALFGHQLWHPMADEFGCSAELAKFLLAQDIWSTDLAHQGLEFWLPVAVAGGAFSVSQSVLGRRVLAPGGPLPPLGATVGRVAGALFAIAERHEAAWLDVHGSEPVAVFGVPPGPATRVAAIDPARMLDGFRQGVRDLLPIWERILSPDTLGDLLTLSEQPTGEFRLADRLWARIVYDFLLAYRARVMHRGHIARSLAPLYLGCAASLVLATRGRLDPVVAQATERLGRAFEDEKPYLLDRWR